MSLRPESLPDQADRVILSINPKAGRRPSAARGQQLAELLGQRGLHVEVLTDLAEVADRANRLHERGQLRALVGVGGDGTAAELVNRTEVGVPITLLAAGTANLLAKQFRLSSKPARLCETIATGEVLRLDAGKAADRVFLVMISCGFDAEVVRQVHAVRESRPQGAHISYWSYVRPIVRSIRSYPYPEIRVNCGQPAGPEKGGKSALVAARWVFVFNLPRYGWGLPLAPKAVATDGALDLVTFRRGTLFHGLRYVAAAQVGLHPRMADCVIRRDTRFRIAADQPVPYQLDGDPGGLLPVDVEVLRGRFTLVVPRELAEK